MSWTQPLCEQCWFDERDDAPTRILSSEIERCCMCGRRTVAGIFVRRDPATVYFPAGDDARPTPK